MTGEKDSIYSHEKGIPIEACIEKARQLIEQNGICLFIFDVKRSGSFSNRHALQISLESLLQGLNTEFDEFFPEHSIAVSTRTEKGFAHLLGDGSWAGINSSEVIPRIVSYSESHYPEISFHYNVAKDGYDEDGTRTLK